MTGAAILLWIARRFLGNPDDLPYGPGQSDYEYDGAEKQDEERAQENERQQQQVNDER